MAAEEKYIGLSEAEKKELKEQAREFLDSRYFYAAADQFKKLIENDPDDEEDRIGALMAEKKIADEDALMRYYRDLFSIPEYEIKLACDKEEEHIEEMCEKNYVEDYLKKDEIRKAYDFDLSYKSCLFSRRKQKEEILKTIEGNDQLRWLKEKGSSFIRNILQVYDLRIADAQAEDEENVRRIRNDYQRFLYKVYTDVKDRNRRALEEKEDDYQHLIREYEKCDDVNKARDLVYGFGRFKEYKDAKEYIKLCEQKADQLRKEENDRSAAKKIKEYADRAKAALVTGKYDEALGLFTDIVSLDPQCEEGYLGILMSRSKTHDVDELFDYYKTHFDEEEAEVLQACEEDSLHIEEMCKKYALPGYLDEKEIREKYRYDRTYRSHLKQCIRQKEHFEQETQTDPAFMWLKRNGSPSVRDRIADLYDTYSYKVEEARSDDLKKVEEIRNDYQRFLFKTYASIRKIYDKASAQKEENYRKLIRSFELAADEQKLDELVLRFQELQGYKEADRYVSLCLKKIEDLKEKEKKESISQEIEAALIAGKAYLSLKNEELADQNFARVLTLDPGNPRAYLGILMLETGSKNIDELVDYYKNLYSQDEKKVLEACKEEREHIDRMIEKYAIPGYFEKEEIEKYYSFDRTYESVTESRRKQKDAFLEEIRMNPLLAKVAEGKDEEIVSFLDRVKEAYEQRITESKENDEDQCSSIRHIYEVYIMESDKSVIRIHDERQKAKDETDEAVYRRNVDDFARDLSEEELEELIGRFDLDYKDGPVYVKKCKERIRDLRLIREKEKLDQLLENGTALLESGMYNQAKQRFEEYLKIDPENEESHLKILMAEKKVSNIEALFEYYRSLYSDEIFEKKEAVAENTDHIDEMCARCFIEGQLDKEEIKKRYKYERSYESLVNARLVQRQQIEDEIMADPLLRWIYENGSDENETYIEDLLDVYDQRIEDAKADDEQKAEEIRKGYKTFLRNTDREVRSLYNELNKERNRRLKEAEKERRETEHRQKEEQERQERFKKEEELRLAKLKEDLENRELSAREQKKADTVIQQTEVLSEKKEEAPEIEKKQQIISKDERDKQKAAAEKQKLEKQAALRLEKERKQKEKQEKALQAKLLKEEKKRKKAEEKEKQSARSASSPKASSFRPNFALIAAALSLGVLMFVVYTFVLEPSNKYKEASGYVESGAYDEAIALFSELGDYKDSAFKVKETTYKKAEDLYDRNELIEAANIFNTLRFNDSEDRLKQIKNEIISDAEAGDTIFFGDYEQDGNTGNGKEMIEWIVLEKQEGSILVISKFALDAQKFNSSSDEVYWENCSLRSWLNGRFPDNAFAREDPSSVLQTTLTNLKYPEGSEDIDIDELMMEEYETRDRLFLLDSSQIEEYFPKEESRICIASDYAIENGVAANADNSCSWWLRNANELRNNTNLIIKGSDGSIDESMYEIINAVRPAMWLKAD